MKRNTQKCIKTRSLHYVKEASKFRIEKYFNFLKMDKKNVQNENIKIFYVKSLDCEHFKKLR